MHGRNTVLLDARLIYARPARAALDYRGFESSKRISGEERGGGIRVGEATNRAQIRQKLVKSMLDFPITTDARLTVIPAFARRSPF